MDNFNEFIGTIKDKKDINYYDFIHVINACNAHYYENRYDDTFFSGIHPKKKRKIYTLPNLSQQYSMYYDNQNLLQENCQTLPMYNYWSAPYFGPRPDQICEVRNLNEVANVLEEKKIDKPKKHIDFDIDNLSDLLQLIQQHPYSEEYEYNIDLKGLHSIQPELINLNNMVGIKELKKSVINQLIYFIQQPLLGSSSDFKHTILCGPPGTGKTEIAKILGQMYCKIGLLKNNIFKKVTRNDLVAGYLGQTAIKTKDVINSCLGGCLFLDEAYSLGSYDNSDSFAKECVDTLCEALSDHKDDLMVIVAGYEEDLKNHFFAINRGLESRFIWKFTMEEYSTKEMVEIFEKKVAEQSWILSEELSIKKMVEWLDPKKENFRHFGRDIEILFSHVKICHSRRVYGKSHDLLKKITLEDMDRGYTIFLDNGKKKQKEFYSSLYL